MYAYVIRRVLLLIPTLFLVTLITFSLVRLMPGSVVDIIVNELMGLASGAAAVTGGDAAGSGSQVDRAAIEHSLGLDVPIHVQYGRWIGVLATLDPNTGESEYKGIFQGRFGVSLRTGRDATEEILHRMPITIELGLLSAIIGNVIGIPIGIYSAIRQDTWLDYLGRSFAILSLATPAFWLATILIVYGSIYFHWAPAVEYVPFSVDPIENLKILIIPAVLMGTAQTGGMMRFLRTITLEVLRQDYVRTAWSKGLRERVIVVRHALKNAMIPLLNMFIPQISALIGGAVIMEQIFCLPGMGRYMLDMIIERDYWVVSGSNLIFATFTMFMILIIDISYAWADPRIRYR